MARKQYKARGHAKARPRGILELTSQGFGFVKTAEGEWFIPASKVGGAFPGDLVEISPLPHDSVPKGSNTRKPTARVRKVVMRSQSTLVGRYEVAEPFGVVVPEDHRIPYDIFTLRKDAPHVPDGSIVEVELVEYPSRTTAATGRVIRVLGSPDDPGIDIDLIIAENDLETTFDDAVVAEAQSCSLDVAGAFASGYRDARSEFIFTIDPFDARDYDDAVSCSFVDGKYHLGVYIADVARYVTFSSHMDFAARRRATSVYLVDRVLPMLPERISNDLCSLVPAQDRLTMSVRAVIRRDGTVESFVVDQAVIRSKVRLSYDQAEALIEAPDADSALAAYRSNPAPYGALPLDAPSILQVREASSRLHELAQLLHAKRYARGCMDFDRVEARVILDGEGHPVDVSYRRRTDATQAIEEAMILANRLVAEWLGERGMPCVFRVHEAPDADALRGLTGVLQEMDVMKGLDKTALSYGDPRVLQDVLKRVEGHPEQELVNSLVLRSMKRAVYRAEDQPHYGLALDHYCHFTSPIRRYPDLLVHRMVKQALCGFDATYEAQKNALAWLAEHSSKKERTAEKAAYESQMLKLVEFLERQIGQTFDGVIAGVSTFGLTVRLENTAKGIFPVEALGDEYFSFDPDRWCLTGMDTATRYRLGQPVRVVLVEAVPRERRLRFRLARG